MAFEKSACGIWLPNSADRNCSPPIGGVRFYAENGMVCMSKELPNGDEEFLQMPPSEARERLAGMEELAVHDRSIKGPDAETRKLYADLTTAMRKAIVAAEEQGPFEDESSRRDRVIRRKKTFLMPGLPAK